MRTLYDAQNTHATEIYRALLTRRAALDTSATGTGKTVMSASIAQYWAEAHGPVGVVCPKAVVSAWRRELELWGVKPLFIHTYEKLKNGVEGIIEIKRQRKYKSGKTSKSFKWVCHPNTLLIFDEVQKCRTARSQAAHLLVAATRDKLTRLMLSATAAKDPTEMWALGFALGLHDLNDSSGKGGWLRWLRDHGCFQDPWRNWKYNASKSLVPLRDELYDRLRVARGISVADVAEAFRGNRVIIDPVDVKGARKIYESNQVTREVVEKLLGELQEKKEKDYDLKVTEILRARQEVELLKIPTFVEQTVDLLNEGFSVASFFCFRESVAAYEKALDMHPVSCIMGGQSGSERQEAIDAFQANRVRVAGITVQAGGTGLSLHDEHGDHPRVALISPTFSVQDYKQVLGRIYRAGGKSDALQKILVAAGTIEEHVLHLCAQKTKTMEEMLGRE